MEGTAFKRFELIWNQVHEIWMFILNYNKLGKLVKVQKLKIWIRNKKFKILYEIDKTKYQNAKLKDFDMDISRGQN